MSEGDWSTTKVVTLLVPKVHAAMASAMAEIGGVAKTRKNAQQGYTFRGIADVTLACQPVMARYGLTCLPTAVLDEHVEKVTTSKGTEMTHIRQRIQFTFFCGEDGSSVNVVTTGEAMDTGDKTSNKVMSAALKYALVQSFCIPEDDPLVDTEATSPEAAAKSSAPMAPPPAAPPPAEPPVAGDKASYLAHFASLTSWEALNSIRADITQNKLFPGDNEIAEASLAAGKRLRAAGSK